MLDGNDDLLQGQLGSDTNRAFERSYRSPRVAQSEFMKYSTCCADDFLHPRFRELCEQLDHPFRWHRKLWEWVFIVHHLLESGLVKPGSRGLVFGVGKERLPALFAGMGAEIVATDAPTDIGVTDGWIETGQHLSSREQIRYPAIVDGALFDKNVSFRTCDMRNIDPELNGFDFNWSSCCFEHLGSLGAGMDFVINAVENTLRDGGVAVHTTEFNLSSNDHTVDEGETVIYRRRDIEELVTRLQDRGHIVKAIVVAPNSHYFDFHVDTPPFTDLFHLKLQLWEYVATSIGIVVERGRV